MNNKNNKAIQTVGGMSLYRKGLGGMLLSAFYTAPGMDLATGMLTFTGGKYGDHSISYEPESVTGDIARALFHWEGYCSANGLGLTEGKRASYHSMSALRTVRILSEASPVAKTVLVSGFTYKHGGTGKARRVAKNLLSV